MSNKKGCLSGRLMDSQGFAAFLFVMATLCLRRYRR